MKGRALLAIVALGVLARLIGIDGPPFGHHWIRQYDTAAFARNFAEGGLHILHPQVDWRGDSNGEVESEFPAYAWLVALLYSLFGVHEWLGRALNVALFVPNAWLVFRLGRRFFDDDVAGYALFFFCVSPLGVFFSRTFQGDTLLCLALLVALERYQAFLDRNLWRHLFVSALAAALAVSIKPFAAYVGLPLLWMTLQQKGPRALRGWAPWVHAAIALGLPLAWYDHAYGLWLEHGNTMFRGYARLDVPGLFDPFWGEYARTILERLYFQLATPPGFLFLAAGVLCPLPRAARFLWAWVFGFGLSMLAFNEAHFDHDYYQYPLLLPGALFMAHGAATLLRRGVLSRGVLAALGAACVVSSAWTVSGMHRIEGWERDNVVFGKRLGELVPADALVVCVQSGGDPRRGEWYQHRIAPGLYALHNPIDFYLSHRRGWSLDDAQLQPDLLELLHQRGARYLASSDPRVFQPPGLAEWLSRHATPVEQAPAWSVYRLLDAE